MQKTFRCNRQREYRVAVATGRETATTTTVGMQVVRHIGKVRKKVSTAYPPSKVCQGVEFVKQPFHDVEVRGIGVQRLERSQACELTVFKVKRSNPQF